MICIKLLEKGIEYARINIEDIPEKLKIRYSVGPKSDPLIEFKIRNQKFRVSDVNIVFFRHFELDLAQLGSNELTSVFCHREWHDAYDIMRTNLKCPLD